MGKVIATWNVKVVLREPDDRPEDAEALDVPTNDALAEVIVTALETAEFAATTGITATASPDRTDR